LFLKFQFAEEALVNKSRMDRYLIIFGKTARIVEPGQRTLNDPPLGQDLPLGFNAY